MIPKKSRLYKLKNNSKILTRPQRSIFSAATVIMVMVAVSRVLGLVRNRILAQFFSAETLSVYFAAFRLPEIIFEVLVLGTFASALIPVFTSYFGRKKEKEAWHIAAMSLNFSFLIFGIFMALVFWLAKPLYGIIVPGFSSSQLEKVIVLTRILVFAQGFFLLSYFLTAILESLRRFLVPAIAPLFYNLGIILGTVFLTGRFGILAPAIGAVVGAFFHFLVQLPLAVHLGFKLQKGLSFSHPGLKKIGRLAFPRVIELAFLQVSKSLELFLASIIGSAAYTYLSFASSLQLFPISLFGASIAKASLPSLSYQAGKRDRFREIFLSSFRQILFLTMPFSVLLAVLRIPIVRLLFGAPRFDWYSTLQTSYALSAFCLGITTQSLVFLLNRSFYALHDTVTPMLISIVSIFLNVLLGLILVLVFKFSAWGLALAVSLASLIRLLALLALIHKKYISFSFRDFFLPFSKISLASFLSGGTMYVLLKVLDRSVWDKRLSFLGKLGLSLPATFDLFVLDTRHSFNLILITFLVAIFGGMVYFFSSWCLGIKEFFVLTKMVTKIERFWKKGTVTIDESSHVG